MERAEKLAHLHLDAYLDELRVVVDDGLASVLAGLSAPPIVLEGMRYAVLGGGKRLRPCLTLATADALAPRLSLAQTVARGRVLPGACAVELVHAYSLVHDDLPAMDNDTLRRGRPTAHVVFGEGLAILVGDGLLTEAFSALADLSSAAPADRSDLSSTRLRAIARLAAAAGAAGMVGGQAIDLAAADPRFRLAAIDRALVDDMHARKTGALIRAAVTIAAILLDADAATVTALDTYARELGLAFQIIDDVLDVQGSDAEIGKTPGKDAASGKPSYPALIGVDASRAIAADCCARAKAALDAAHLGGRLGEIADWTLGRRK